MCVNRLLAAEGIAVIFVAATAPGLFRELITFFLSAATSILDWLQTRGIADDTEDAKFVLSQLLTAGFLAPANVPGGAKSARYTWGPRKPFAESEEVCLIIEQSIF